MPKGFKTCKRCTATISAAAKVCKECGAAQLDAQYAERKKQPRGPKAAGHATAQSDSEASEAELNAMMSDSESAREERVDAEDSDAAYAVQPAGAEDYLPIPQATNKAVTQPGERLDCLPFEWQHYLKDKRPMLELKAGTNVWYQATIIGESKTEIKVDFPATNKTPHVQEWVNKCSSRVWRGPMGGNAWRYIKGSDGAWAPKVGSGTNTAGSRQRGSWQKTRQRRSGGQGRSRDETPTVTGTGTGDTARARLMAEAAMDTAASPQQPRPARPVPGVVKVGVGRGGIAAAAAVSEDDSGWEDSGSGARASPLSNHQPHQAFEQSLPHDQHLHQPPQQQEPQQLWDEPHAAPSNPQQAQPKAMVAPKVEEEEEGTAVGLPSPQAASPGSDPLAAWFESHFVKLESSGRLGEGAEGRAAEAGGGCWPLLPQRTAPHDDEVVRSGGKGQHEQQQPGAGSKRKERSSPGDGQQPGKVPQELRRLKQWGWDRREGGNASGSESSDEEMGSDDDSMSGSRDHVPGEQPQQSSSPGPWQQPRTSPDEQQQERRASPPPKQEPQPSAAKQQGPNKEDRRPGHAADPGAREVVVRVVEQVQPPRLQQGRSAAAAPAEQQHHHRNHHPGSSRPHEPGREQRQGNGPGEQAGGAAPPPGSQDRPTEKGGTGAPAAGAKPAHKAGKRDGGAQSRPVDGGAQSRPVDGGKRSQQRDFFSRPAAGPAPQGRQQQGTQQQGVAAALGATSQVEREPHQQPQQHMRPSNQSHHSQLQVVPQQQHVQSWPQVGRRESEQSFRGSTVASKLQPQRQQAVTDQTRSLPPAPGGRPGGHAPAPQAFQAPPQPAASLKRKSPAGGQGFAVEIVARASRAPAQGPLHGHFPLPTKGTGGWGGGYGRQGARSQQGAHMNPAPPLPFPHFGNPMPPKERGWLQH